MASAVPIQILIVSGHDLPRMDLPPGKIDGYVWATVEDGESTVLAESTTAVINANYDPRWNHVFSFVPSAAARTVRFKVFDKDMLRSEYVGELVLPLQALLSGQPPARHPIALAPKVKARRKAAGPPSLTVGAHVLQHTELPSSVYAAAAGSAPTATVAVQVTVHRAAALPKMDLLRKIDPYVVATVTDSLTGAVLHQFRTAHVLNNFAPTWEHVETLHVAADPAARPRVEFVVYDKDRLTKDDAAGRVDVSLRPLDHAALALLLAPGARPSKKSPASQLWVSVSASAPLPDEWNDDDSADDISHVRKRTLAKRLLTDPEVQMRVQAVRTMDGPGLDRYFNMGLLADVKAEMDTGDLLLFRGAEEFSMAIRSATHSNWSHSALIVRNPPADVRQLYQYERYVQDIHAYDHFAEHKAAMLADDVFVFEAESETLLITDGVQDGMQLVPITYWLAKYYDEAGPECLLCWRKLARPGSPVGLDGEQRTRMMMWLRETAGKRYKASKRQQYNCVLRLNMRKDYSSFFCSELVAATLSELGVLPAYQGGLIKRLRKKSAGRKQLASNYLPCDFSSEERHDGRDLACLEPFVYLRERRVRLEPPQLLVDAGRAAFAFTDTVRKRMQTAYPDCKPYALLLDAGSLSGWDDAAALTAALRGSDDDSDTVVGMQLREALHSGWIRPYLALVALHPVVRLQIAMLLRVDITTPAWYGQPHREAGAVLQRLVAKSGKCNWAQTLLACARLCGDHTDDLLRHVAAATKAELAAAASGDEALEQRLLLPLELAVCTLYRTLAEQQHGSPLLDPAAVPASFDALRDAVGEQNAERLAVLRQRLASLGPLLSDELGLRFCSFVMQGGQQRCVKLVTESWSVQAAGSSRVRKALPLIVAQLALQILFVLIDGVGSLRQFYPTPSSSASSSCPEE